MMEISLILLVPYFGWGVFSLHRKFLLHEDWPLAIEIATMAGLILFYAITLPLLRPYLITNPGLLVFAGLGLFVSSFALYGHMMINLVSRFLVDLVMTPDDGIATSPRLGPAESLERVRDYEGAYAEYLVLARMYPNETMLKLRLARCCSHLERHAEAADWLDRAIARADGPDDHAMMAVQLAEVAEHKLDDADRAIAALRNFIERHPAHEDAPRLTERMKRVGQVRKDAAPGGGLESMQDHPAEETEAAAMPELPQPKPSTKKKKAALAPLGEQLLTPEPEPAPDPDPVAQEKPVSHSDLQALEELSEPLETPDDEPSPKPGQRFTLDPMRDADEEQA
ncbi:MAG: hypothetical protein GC168_02210 [Candidatus Hydrogenedens sp.]|nr:hypothetical protein [Candidatus Hydrogenedens sp.]